MWASFCEELTFRERKENENIKQIKKILFLTSSRNESIVSRLITPFPPNTMAGHEVDMLTTCVVAFQLGKQLIYAGITSNTSGSNPDILLILPSKDLRLQEE